MGRMVTMVVWGGKGVILAAFLLRQTRMKSGHFIEVLRTWNALPFSSCVTSKM
jgi:hypothetical protein